MDMIWRLTDEMLVDFAGRDVELALWKAALGKGSVEHVAGILVAEDKDAGIDSLGQIPGKADGGSEAARSESRGRLQGGRGVHRAAF